MPLAAHLKISRHGVYYFRVVIPVPLRPSFGGRCEIKKSLNTRNPRIAKRFAYNLSSYVLALFDEVRQMAGYDPKRFNPNDPSTWPTSAGQKYEIDLQRGIFKADPRIPGDHEKMMEAMDKIGMLPVARSEVASPSTIAAVESAVSSAFKALPVASAYTARKPLKISEVIPLYVQNLKQRNKTVKTQETYQSNCIKFLAAIGGDKFIHEVTEDDIDKYKDWCLVDDPTLLLQSQDGRLYPISGLLKYAKKSGHFPKDIEVPTVGKFALTKTEREKLAVSAEPFKVEELQTIFEKSAYLIYASGNPARYWLPLLSLYTGARIEELAQLHKSDLSNPQGVRILHINDLDNKKVKSPAGKRFVPIHPVLWDLGWKEYLNDIERLYPNEIMVFPHLVNTKNGYSAAVGKAFNTYLQKLAIKKIGDDQRKKVFHSFRHTMNNEMFTNGVSLEKRCELVGHELNNVNSRVYTQTTPHKVLMDDCLLKLRYEREDGTGKVIKLNLSPLTYKVGLFDESLPSLMNDKASGASHRKSKARAAALKKKPRD